MTQSLMLPPLQSCHMAQGSSARGLRLVHHALEEWVEESPACVTGLSPRSPRTLDAMKRRHTGAGDSRLRARRRGWRIYTSGRCCAGHLPPRRQQPAPNLVRRDEGGRGGGGCTLRLLRRSLPSSSRAHLSPLENNSRARLRVRPHMHCVYECMHAPYP